MRHLERFAVVAVLITAGVGGSPPIGAQGDNAPEARADGEALVQFEQAEQLCLRPDESRTLEFVRPACTDSSLHAVATISRPEAACRLQREVRLVQGHLARLGYDVGTPDGILCAQTCEALRQFQGECCLDGEELLSETTCRALEYRAQQTCSQLERSVLPRLMNYERDSVDRYFFPRSTALRLQHGVPPPPSFARRHTPASANPYHVVLLRMGNLASEIAWGREFPRPVEKDESDRAYANAQRP